MPLRKVAPTTQTPTQKRGQASTAAVLAYDAGADQYYPATGEDADAYLVYDAGAEQYYPDDVTGSQTATIRVVGSNGGKVLTEEPARGRWLVPTGITSERPTQPLTGQKFFDTEAGRLVWWTGSAWV